MRTLVLVVLLSLAACSPAREDLNLVTTMAGVGKGDIRDWEKLTPQDRITAHYKLTRAAYVLDFNLNGHPIPAEFLPIDPTPAILEKAR